MHRELKRPAAVSQARPDKNPESLAESDPRHLPAVPERGPLRVYASQLDVAGYHRVTAIRGDREFCDQFYLDQECGADCFAAKAAQALAEPEEDAAALVQEIVDMVAKKRWEFWRGQSQVLVVPLSESRSSEVDWLWPERIALGKLTLLVGDPGVGKSLVALDIAARVSLGDLWPDDSVDALAPDAGGALIFSEMDDIDDTLRPRLDAIGVDMERISIVQNYRKVGLCGHTETVPFSQAADLDAIGASIRRVRRCKLVIIDPLSAYIGAKPTRQELADFMRGLVETAASHSVAVLLVSSHNSSSHSLFHYGPQGHANFGAVARSVWKVMGDPEHPDRRVLLPLKNNLASDWRGLRFRITSSLDNLAPRIEWEHKSLDVRVARATYQPPEDKRLPNSYQLYRQMMHQWLRDQLRDGERFAQEIHDAAAQERIGLKTLRLALREIGGTFRKGPTGQWVWSLPHEADSPPKQLPCAS